jgi:hypothetical protein
VAVGAGVAVGVVDGCGVLAGDAVGDAVNVAVGCGVAVSAGGIELSVALAGAGGGCVIPRAAPGVSSRGAQPTTISPIRMTSGQPATQRVR